MAAFKVGDQVRIHVPNSPIDGLVGAVVYVGRNSCQVAVGGRRALVLFDELEVVQ